MLRAIVVFCVEEGEGVVVVVVCGFLEWRVEECEAGVEPVVEDSVVIVVLQSARKPSEVVQMLPNRLSTSKVPHSEPFR